MQQAAGEAVLLAVNWRADPTHLKSCGSHWALAEWVGQRRQQQQRERRRRPLHVATHSAGSVSESQWPALSLLVLLLVRENGTNGVLLQGMDSVFPLLLLRLITVLNALNQLKIGTGKSLAKAGGPCVGVGAKQRVGGLGEVVAASGRLC